MRMILAYLIAAVAVCLAADVAMPLGDQALPPMALGSVVILAAEPIQPDVDVALVDAAAATDDYFVPECTQLAALEAVKKKAVKLCAHAIILTEKSNRSYGGPLWKKPQLSRKAIRYVGLAR